MSHLTDEDRYYISCMYQEGKKQKEIAEKIGKHPSVVSRELRRNRDQQTGSYNPKKAHAMYKKRMKTKPKHIYFTEEIKQTVLRFLSMDYSPEQIVGRCKILGIKCVSHETIYQFIWNDKKAKGLWYKHLRRQGRKNKKRGSKHNSRGISGRVGIENRPDIVDAKVRFGDLEIDTVIGRNHKRALVTINDRVTGICRIARLKGKNAKELAYKVIELLSPYKGIIKTITADNGREFAEHKMIAEALGIDFYFANPYSSWERGANENLNGLIRQYLPKKSSFENISDDFIWLIQTILNNRPRKKLGYLTPIEFFNRNFAQNYID